jgi:hypothetical protein
VSLTTRFSAPVLLLIVFPELHFPAILPLKNNPLKSQNFELPSHKPWIPKPMFGHLTFSAHGQKTCPPGHGSGRDVVIAGDLDTFNSIASLPDSNNLVKMPRIEAYPLPFEVYCLYLQFKSRLKLRR